LRLDNQAEYGGGIAFFNTSDPLNVSQNVIFNNTATIISGGIDICNGCFPTIHGNDLYNNQVILQGTAKPNDLSDENVVGTQIDASQNWWGTTNPTAVDRRVYDHQDNAALGTVTVLAVLSAALPLPGLSSGAVANPPTSANQLDNLALPYIVANNGPGPASASTLGFYLSPVPNLADGSIKLVGSPAVMNLAGGSSATGTATELIPGLTPSGSYYLVICANDTHTVLETTTGNNCAASTTVIQIGSGGTE
jgi:hypothetical protein